jgi:hypothetical protein
MGRMTDDKLEPDTPHSVFYRGRSANRRRAKCYSFEKSSTTQMRIEKQRYRAQRRRAK